MWQRLRALLFSVDWRDTTMSRLSDVQAKRTLRGCVASPCSCALGSTRMYSSFIYFVCYLLYIIIYVFFYNYRWVALLRCLLCFVRWRWLAGWMVVGRRRTGWEVQEKPWKCLFALAVHCFFLLLTNNFTILISTSFNMAFVFACLQLLYVCIYIST